MKLEGMGGDGELGMKQIKEVAKPEKILQKSLSKSESGDHEERARVDWLRIQ